jgi:hypothetical protein
MSKCHNCFEEKECDSFDTVHYGLNYLCKECQYKICASMYFDGCK